MRIHLHVAATVIAFALIITVAASSRGAAPAPAGASPALTIEQVLSTTSHEQMISWMTQKVDDLATLLAGVTDEPSARRTASAAEWCFLEMELIGCRIGMLPRPSPAELSRLQPQVRRFEQARSRLARETMRLRNAPADVISPLRGVLAPVYDHVRGDAARKSHSLATQLQTLRSQVELYKLQHRDRAPDFRTQGWRQLTGRTDESGTIHPAAPFGPYLQQPLVNPLTNSSTLLITRSAPGPNFRYAQADCGFIFDESTGRLWAIDMEGRLFDEDAGYSMNK